MSLKRWLGIRLRLSVRGRANPLPIPSARVEAGHAVESFEVGPPGLEQKLEEPWLKGEIIQEMQRFLQGQRSNHTRRAYEGDLRQFIGYLRAEVQSGESFDALLAYRDWLVKPKSQGGPELTRSSANRKFATIRSFLTWLQARGRVKENPSLWIKNYRAQTESPTQAFSDAEVAQILTLPNQKSRSGLMHATVLHFLFYLGLRRGELAALRVNHLGWSRVGEHTILTVRVPGKGDKERILPVPLKMQGLLLRYLDSRGFELGRDESYLFAPVKNNLTKVKEKPIDSQSIYYIVKKYAQAAGIERRVSPHSCRATAISNALDHAASHRAVQQMAGWSSPLMIARYDKRRTDLQHSAVHVVDY